jgi:hypothetical protein
VFAAFLLNFTVTPAGMFTVVKLKTPLGGRLSVVLAVGLKAPSAPVLPLLNVCADAPVAASAQARAPAGISKKRRCRIVLDLLLERVIGP